MTFNCMIMILAPIWVVCAPVGYIVTRWSNRAMGIRWTHNDRLYAIIFSVIYGPLMSVIGVLTVLIYKLCTSEWGNKEAGW